jgi:hypothetical protein
MRSTAPGSVWGRLGALLDGLLIIVGVFVVAEFLLVTALLIEPTRDLGVFFQLQTIARVPADVWQADGLVRVVADRASIAAAPLVRIRFGPGSRAFVFAASAASFAWWACVILVLVQLRGVLASLSPQAPFPRENVRRMRVIGGGILAAAAVELLAGVAVVTFMRTMVTVAGRPADVPVELALAEFPLGTILGGLAVIFLAEIFRKGADLQDEQSLTI